MNKTERKALAKMQADFRVALESLQSNIGPLRSTAESARATFEALSEHARNTDKGQACEAEAGDLESCAESLDTLVDDLEALCEALDSLAEEPDA